MPVFPLLDRSPSPRATRWLLLLALAGTVVSYLVMGYIFLLSGDTAGIFASQLSFSADFLRNQYAAIIASGGMDYYRLAQTLDFGFMIAYGLLAFALSITIARKFDPPSRWRASGFIVAIIGPLSAILDAVENGFILATLSDPAGFPAWWAIAHSSFALAKWLVLFGAIGWAVIASLARVVVKKDRA